MTDQAQTDGTGFVQSRFVAELIERMPVAQDLGIELDEVSHGRAVISLAVAERHTFDGTTVQAGISALLADFAAVAAAASTLHDGWLAATTGFSVHHLAPARGRVLQAIGSVVRGGSRNLVAHADVYVKDQSEDSHCLTGIFTAAGISPSGG